MVPKGKHRQPTPQRRYTKSGTTPGRKVDYQENTNVGKWSHDKNKTLSPHYAYSYLLWQSQTAKSIPCRSTRRSKHRRKGISQQQHNNAFKLGIAKHYEHWSTKHHGLWKETWMLIRISVDKKTRQMMRWFSLTGTKARCPLNHHDKAINNA